MPPRYRTTPITEAIIDLRATLPEDCSVEQLAEVHARVRERFPTTKPLHKREVMVHAEPQSSMRVDTSEQLLGYRFETADGLDIFQARLDGFTFNRLAPYQSWERLRDSAHELWGAYKEACAPTAVTRVAVRYINRLDLPAAEVDLNEYLLTVPEIGPDLPQVLNHYFMQLSCPQPDIDSMLLINEAMLPQPAPDKSSILLDFDLFREHHWPILEEDAVWAFLEVLRDRKNLAFEASITDATRRLYL